MIFGGSQGAHAINVAMVEAAPRLAAARLAGWQSRIRQESAIWNWSATATGGAGLEARVEPFLYAMDGEVKAADLVVCRAGATTLAELAAAGGRRC